MMKKDDSRKLISGPIAHINFSLVPHFVAKFVPAQGGVMAQFWPLILRFLCDLIV